MTESKLKISETPLELESVEVTDLNRAISETEQAQTNELAKILNSPALAAKSSDFCGSYNQIKGYIPSTISLLLKLSGYKLLPNSWRNVCKTTAQMIGLLKQICDKNCP